MGIPIFGRIKPTAVSGRYRDYLNGIEDTPCRRKNDEDSNEGEKVPSNLLYRHRRAQKCLPGANQMDNVYVYDVDDLNGISNENETRANEARLAEAVVFEQAQRF